MRIKNWTLLSLLGCAFTGSMLADTPVIPRPAVDESPDFGVPVKKGVRICSSTKVQAAEGLENEAAHLKVMLDAAGNVNQEVKDRIELSIDKNLPGEGYELTVNPDKAVVTIKGGDAAGVFYGIQTLKQLLPPKIYAKGYEGKGSYMLPALVIKDAPAFPWRGVMLDTARHFKSKEYVKRFIDLMSIHKMNRLHWHLVDSEGWRLEIKKYPKLTEVAKGTPLVYPGEDPTDKSKPAVFKYGYFHGADYYTQDEVREIVAYAKSRHVEIMPEIEFPGHSMIALTAYPEFSTTRKIPEVRSNISPDLIGVHDEALQFLKDVLDETMELFPFEMIHFGGDESPKGQWKNSPEAQAKIKELGFTGEKPEDQLQAWMFNEMTAHIAKKGRRPAGWEEIMHGKNLETLSKKAVVWAWLSGRNAVKAANQGFGAVHVQTGPFYLDSWQTSSPADNWALYRGPFTMKRIYDFNLLPDGLTDEGRKNIYGAQGQLWGELMPHEANVEYQGYPRLCALAELTWTEGGRKDYENFYKRLLTHTQRLDAMNVQYRYVDPLPSGAWGAEQLKESTFDIPVRIPAQVLLARVEREVDAVADFIYTGGASALEMKKAELVIGGKVVSVDEHNGMAGSKYEDSSYKFKINRGKLPKSLKPVEEKDEFGEIVRYFEGVVRVTHANKEKENSTGNVLFYTGTGVELFNPRNFAGGDYPSATWNSGEFTKEVASVRIPMDGIVKEAGEYELVFQIKQDNVDAVFGGVSVTGTDGVGTTVKESAKLGKGEKTAFLAIKLKDSDVKEGNSISFKVKSKPSVAGEVRVRLMKTLPLLAEGKYTWNPSLFEGGRVSCYAHNVSPAKDGEMKVSFHFKSGSHGLDIKGVQVVRDGVVVAESSQSGFAGNNPKDNVYTLSSPALKKGQKYDLRLNISGSGGTNTSGEIVVE